MALDRGKVNNVFPVKKGRDPDAFRIDLVQCPHPCLWLISLPSNILRSEVVFFRDTILAINRSQFIEKPALERVCHNSIVMDGYKVIESIIFEPQNSPFQLPGRGVGGKKRDKYKVHLTAAAFVMAPTVPSHELKYLL